MKIDNKTQIRKIIENFRNLVNGLENEKKELLFQIKQVYQYKDKLSLHQECLITILFNELDDELYVAISKFQDLIIILENLLGEN
jgi:hypothetical protein